MPTFLIFIYHIFSLKAMQVKRANFIFQAQKCNTFPQIYSFVSLCVLYT